MSWLLIGAICELIVDWGWAAGKVPAITSLGLPDGGRELGNMENRKTESECGNAGNMTIFDWDHTTHKELNNNNYYIEC